MLYPVLWKNFVFSISIQENNLQARGKTSVSYPNSLNPDPDPGFDDQKYKRFFFMYTKFTVESKCKFLIKNSYILFLGPYERLSNHEISSLFSFLWVILPL